MRRALLSVLVISFVLAGAAGISGADRADQAVSELRSDWAAVQSMPSGTIKTVEMNQLRSRARSLARQYPENADVQTWAAVVVSGDRNPVPRRPWRG